MKILSIDVGGRRVKILRSGHGVEDERRADSGPEMTPSQMIEAVRGLAEGWTFDVASVGFPAPIRDGGPAVEPVNLGKGWVGFDFEAALGCPVKVINDAAMQALGSYEGGKMLFLGLGTGLGTALVADGLVLPLEIAHLPYRKGRTFEEYLGDRARKERGSKKWRTTLADVTSRFHAAFLVDYIVLGGGNVKHVDDLPPNCRRGDNDNAFLGGFRLWESA